MDKSFSVKKYNKSIAGKIIVTCLLGCLAVFSALYISRLTFGKILSTVHKLSKPNERIRLVNDLFKGVVVLDQLQRNQALNAEPGAYNPFLKESKRLQDMLDSLRSKSLQYKTQVVRIDSMKKILDNRDVLYVKYTQLHSVLVQNDSLAGQVKGLSALIEKTRARLDTNVITTSKATKTIVDTVKDDEEKQSFWNRVFSKKKPHVKRVQKQIQEELKVRVDTIRRSTNGDSLARMGRAIARVETNRLLQRALLLKEETDLNLTGNILVGSLISILNDIEHDELLYTEQQNVAANETVNKGIVNISIVFVIVLMATVVLVFLIFADIARSNQYRKELIAARELAEEAGRVKQRFLANMSHELRTPLQTIIGISEQLRTAEDAGHKRVENIYQSSLHLLQIVNEVLDYSRIISGKYVMEDKPFNMTGLLNEVKEMILVQTAMKNLEFQYEINVAGENYYSGDAFRLKQVLLNVLGNAVKYTGEGTVTLSVTESAQLGDTAMFTFVVKDTGTGISAKDMAVIFNEFEQGNNSGRKQGTGLGLNIVKAMVDMQQGTLAVESEPGKGAAFTIKLPFKKIAAGQLEAPASWPLTGSDQHVWVVDDDLFILELCAGILSKYNIQHTCFPAPLQALATPFPPGLVVVLLDVRMVDMDGITLCRELRKRPVADVPKYIALTAQAFPGEQDAILQSGFDGVILKPFLERDILNAVFGQVAFTGTAGIAKPDISVIRKMTANDEGLLAVVLKSFIAETERDIAAARQYRNDNKALTDVLHRLAGRCGQIGADAPASKFRSMEITLHKHRNAAIPADELDSVCNDVAAVIAQIKDLLAADNFPTNC